MQKKNLWEEIRGSSNQRTKVMVFHCFLHVSVVKSVCININNFLSRQTPAASKKYKFVVTGHGKYEKMAVDEHVTKSGEFLRENYIFLIISVENA